MDSVETTVHGLAEVGQCVCAAPVVELVVLRVWGATDADRRRAEDDARAHHALYRYRIAHVEQVEHPHPAAGDPDALACHAEYGRTWAAYRIEGGR